MSEPIVTIDSLSVAVNSVGCFLLVRVYAAPASPSYVHRCVSMLKHVAVVDITKLHAIANHNM